MKWQVIDIHEFRQMRTFRIFLLSLLLAVIFLSCQKEDYIPDVKNGVLKIRRVIISDLPFFEYSYNNPDILKDEKSKTNFINYNYNEKDQLEATDYYSDDVLLSSDLQAIENALNSKELLNLVDLGKGSTLEYKYDIYGKLINTIFSRPAGSDPEYSEFSYDANGRIGRQKLLWDNKTVGYIDYLYDARGNLIKETLYSINSSGLPELSTSTQYEFDNYKNPFKIFHRLMIPGINTNLNNIIKETFTIHFNPGQGTDIIQITLSSYVYNSMGYPVKKNGNIKYIYE